MLLIWSCLARNRSPSLVASCFFGRIVFSDAAIESRFASQGNPKTKSQGYAASDRKTLQTKNCRRPRKLIRLQSLRGCSQTTSQTSQSWLCLHQGHRGRVEQARIPTPQGGKWHL